MKIHLSLLLAVLAGQLLHANAELTVPAFTAYADPDPDALHFSSRSGLTGWDDPGQKVAWFGEIKNAGELRCAVSLALPAGTQSTLKLSVAGKNSVAKVEGHGSEPVTVGFESAEISKPGYYRFSLESLNAKGTSAGNIKALILDGPAAKEAHFNLKPRRNAASVHLAYPLAGRTNVASFYCEMTAIDDPVYSYYMACGWHRGYFGMQVNGPTERRIIFSVWDSGKEAEDRNKVQAEDRVALVAKGEGVEAGDFGNEGTGGHSHLVFPWKTGEKQRFLVTARPTDATHTVFSGYYYVLEKKQWMLISSWKAPKEGGYLRGLYSFSENFGGSNGHLRRKALYGNQWIQTADRQWFEIAEASFSHDPTGREDRLDRFMGVEAGQFFLSHGGYVDGFTKFGEKFHRPELGQAPNDLQLPPLPQ
jgi:hypothetical protein